MAYYRKRATYRPYRAGYRRGYRKYGPGRGRTVYRRRW